MQALILVISFDALWSESSGQNAYSSVFWIRHGLLLQRLATMENCDRLQPTTCTVTCSTEVVRPIYAAALGIFV